MNVVLPACVHAHTCKVSHMLCVLYIIRNIIDETCLAYEHAHVCKLSRMLCVLDITCTIVFPHRSFCETCPDKSSRGAFVRQYYISFAISC